MNNKNLDKCNECGLCNKDSPTYKIIRNEAYSPRNLVRLARKGEFDQRFFLFSIDNSCFRNCPVGVELDFIAIRQQVNKMGKETEVNKQMKSNIKAWSNPVGDSTKAKSKKHLFT